MKNSNPEIKSILNQLDELDACIKEKYNVFSGIKRKERDNSPITQEIKSIKLQKKSLYDSLKQLRKDFWEKEITPYSEKAQLYKDDMFWNHLDNNDEKQQIMEIKDKKKRLAEKNKVFKQIGPRVREKINEDLFQKTSNDPEFGEAWKAIKAAERNANIEVKKLRSESGCFTGTYAHIEDAARVSFKKSMRMPRFRKWLGYNGAVGIQLNGNEVTTKSVMTKQDNRLSISLTGARLHGMNRGTRVAASARIRLAKDRYIDVPFVMHRPLPENAKILWVKLFVKRIGLRNVWEIQFTLKSKEFRAARNPKNDRIAVNLGWRALPDGSIRVATTWDGTDSEEIILSPKMRSEQERIQKLLEYSDKHFNDAKRALSKWKNGRVLSDKERDILENSHVWKAHGKLAIASRELLNIYPLENKKNIWKKWKAERLKNKQDLFDTYDVITQWFAKHGIVDENEQFVLYLDWWRTKDQHLINYARGIERRLYLHRREIYRKAAARWSKKYQTIIIEDWNKSKTARNPSPEYDNRSEQEIQSNSIRQFCGVSVLTNAITLAFGNKNVKKQSAEGISLNHYDCGGIGDNTVNDVYVLCQQCNSLFDQDENAAKHLFERSGGMKIPGTARSSKKSYTSNKKERNQKQKTKSLKPLNERRSQTSV